mmetsp:Transcript_27721/g.61039  ORF Transcript_27721/g.61039 Transcript_27721/m.61039 type:complete len:202 (+) Transcript_27721:207-812(+)
MGARYTHYGYVRKSHIFRSRRPTQRNGRIRSNFWRRKRTQAVFHQTTAHHQTGAGRLGFLHLLAKLSRPTKIQGTRHVRKVRVSVFLPFDSSHQMPVFVRRSQRRHGTDRRAPGGNARLAGEHDRVLHPHGSLRKMANRFPPTRRRRPRNQHRPVEELAGGRARERSPGRTLYIVRIRQSALPAHCHDCGVHRKRTRGRRR